MGGDAMSEIPSTPAATLATLTLDRGRARNLELQVNEVTIRDRTLIAVGLFPAKETTGITIGIGATMSAALVDAQNTLQASLDSVDVAILKLARSR
jgi:hypothetical protein